MSDWIRQTVWLVFLVSGIYLSAWGVRHARKPKDISLDIAVSAIVIGSTIILMCVIIVITEMQIYP